MLLWYNVADENGFNVIWRYFGWANQTLAVFALWTATSYLARRRGSLAYLITLLPAAFMTAVCTTYICIAKIGFNLPSDWNFAIGGIAMAVSLVWFFLWKIRSGLSFGDEKIYEDFSRQFIGSKKEHSSSYVTDERRKNDRKRP